MGYFQVRYNSRVINYNRKLFIRLATEVYGNVCVYFQLASVKTIIATRATALQNLESASASRPSKVPRIVQPVPMASTIIRNANPAIASPMEQCKLQ